MSVYPPVCGPEPLYPISNPKPQKFYSKPTWGGRTGGASFLSMNLGGPVDFLSSGLCPPLSSKRRVILDQPEDVGVGQVRDLRHQRQVVAIERRRGSPALLAVELEEPRDRHAVTLAELRLVLPDRSLDATQAELLDGTFRLLGGGRLFA